MNTAAHRPSRSRPTLAALTTAGLLLLPQAAASQVHPLGAGWIAGVSDVGELNADATGQELTPGAGFIVGVHVDRWFGTSGRLGVRTQVSFQQPEVPWNADERSISTFAADVSLLVRLATPENDLPVLPYLAGGVGGVWYEMGNGPLTDFPGAGAYYDGDSQILPVGLLAAGVDIPTGLRWAGNQVAVRLEAADHVTLQSPLRSLSDQDRYGAVHQLRLTVGLHSAFSN